ncbi:MAG: hypothetical protein K9N35_00230 [Candidatus Marinimicrobia bacterium]|nr:hypothetical protein [Candidatus Neomarinimicrobiota bacterium]
MNNKKLELLYCSSELQEQDAYFETEGHTFDNAFVRHYITNDFTQASHNTNDYSGAFDPSDHALGPMTLTIEVYDFQGNFTSEDWQIDMAK